MEEKCGLFSSVLVQSSLRFEEGASYHNPIKDVRPGISALGGNLYGPIGAVLFWMIGFAMVCSFSDVKLRWPTATFQESYGCSGVMSTKSPQTAKKHRTTNVFMPMLTDGTGPDGKDACPYDTIDNVSRRYSDDLNELRITFIGDSRTRYIFHYVVNVLMDRDLGTGVGQRDYLYAFHQKNLTVDFNWCPYPDNCVTNHTEAWLKESPLQHHYVIFGLGTWTAIYDRAPNVMSTFRANCSRIAKQLSVLSRTTVIWIESFPTGPKLRKSLNYMVPVLGRMRKILNGLAEQYHMPLWRSARKEVLQHKNLYFDGLHFKGPLLKKIACQLLAAIYLRD
ncbi:hypothetical protein BV898_00676 [Hypsibius exemplaris]|uniref:Uncharacterized protein n=1 Tax=Hypsibius exemplaris TaxID=2072580 RepID=A0A1W0XE51_HYPEX|nr:hypothetical protein BV898_00676 [Hypsibius exemplaris]